VPFTSGGRHRSVLGSGALALFIGFPGVFDLVKRNGQA